MWGGGERDLIGITTTFVNDDTSLGKPLEAVVSGNDCSAHLPHFFMALEHFRPSTERRQPLAIILPYIGICKVSVPQCPDLLLLLLLFYY